ncbi:MAG: hypothetical protein WC749_02025 [Dehalococcoidia bacterium]
MTQRRCPSCGSFLAISDDSNYGKCYPCFLVEGRDKIQLDPKLGSNLTLVTISFLLALIMWAVLAAPLWWEG